MTAVAPEPRVAEQRLAALQAANAVRYARAGLKVDLRAGRTRAADILTDPPAFVASMRVVDLLIAIPKVGKWKAHRILVSTATSPTLTVAALSDRQRSDLVGRLA